MGRVLVTPAVEPEEPRGSQRCGEEADGEAQGCPMALERADEAPAAGEERPGDAGDEEDAGDASHPLGPRVWVRHVRIWPGLDLGGLRKDSGRSNAIGGSVSVRIRQCERGTRTGK